MVQLSVPDVASQLNVSPQRVRAMLRSGILRGEQLGGRWLVDAASLGAAGKPAGRPFSERVAWGLVSVVEGDVAVELAPSERSRLKGRWNALLDSDDCARLLGAVMARRAERSRWSAPDPAGLFDDDRFVPSGKSDPRSGISARGYAEGYVQGSDFEDLVADHLLVPARGRENVLLRKVYRPLPVPLPWLVVAADLADGDAREVQQAELLLKRYAARA
ncbi:helix-turn-helix domain-containing protein [Microbacterium aurantiacum]|uniref:helix-turn-helix domain-containing protein n=1 Tax=Microbacterium aurantiacum TaxID=162393 RepID=UPI0012E0CF1A|nr:helix-turn-helix domain-containing protein [Microbacterium chocolatum]